MSLKNPAEILACLRGGLIVSCQAEEGDPFYAPEYVALFARAAELGGAHAIRACGPDFIRAIRAAVSLPIIGITKSSFGDGSVLITAGEADVEQVLDAGADLVAVDATKRIRPGGFSGPEFVTALKQRWRDTPLIADVSTFDEGMAASAAGADAVATTLSGYTPASAAGRSAIPDFGLLRELVRCLSVPVILEGRVNSPNLAARALRLGAFAVVVGTALTRPRVMVGAYLSAMRRSPLCVARTP
jgi:N-acylglucosamine-6-phosphate 2-epimerase